MSTASELADRLKQHIPNGDGYNSQFARDLADAAEYLDRIGTAEPIGFISENGLRYLKTGDIEKANIRSEKMYFATIPVFLEQK